MIVGISNQILSTEHLTSLYKYSIECELFCVYFFVDVRCYYEPATREQPEYSELNFDWDSLDIDLKQKLNEGESEKAMVWIEANRDELERLVGENYTQIETT